MREIPFPISRHQPAVQRAQGQVETLRLVRGDDPVADRDQFQRPGLKVPLDVGDFGHRSRFPYARPNPHSPSPSPVDIPATSHSTGPGPVAPARCAVTGAVPLRRRRRNGGPPGRASRDGRGSCARIDPSLACHNGGIDQVASLPLPPDRPAARRFFVRVPGLHRASSSLCPLAPPGGAVSSEPWPLSHEIGDTGLIRARRSLRHLGTVPRKAVAA